MLRKTWIRPLVAIRKVIKEPNNRIKIHKTNRKPMIINRMLNLKILLITSQKKLMLNRLKAMIPHPSRKNPKKTKEKRNKIHRLWLMLYREILTNRKNSSLILIANMIPNLNTRTLSVLKSSCRTIGSQVRTWWTFHQRFLIHFWILLARKLHTLSQKEKLFRKKRQKSFSKTTLMN